MIIGLTGSYGAGKDTIADHLRSKDFGYHSLSDILRKELVKRGEEVTRENLIEIGNEIRAKFGGGELAKRVLEVIEANQEKNSLIVSIRNPEEVNTLRTRNNFQMWFVDAPPQVRYERTIKRGRSDDFKSFDDFLEKEKQENSSDPEAQQLGKVAEMANVKINNNSDLETLYKKVDALLVSSSQEARRQKSSLD